MESGCWRDCCWSRVNPATPVYGDKPGSKLDDSSNTTTPRKIFFRKGNQTSGLQNCAGNEPKQEESSKQVKKRGNWCGTKADNVRNDLISSQGSKMLPVFKVFLPQCTMQSTKQIHKVDEVEERFLNNCNVMVEANSINEKFCSAEVHLNFLNKEES